MCSPIIIEIEIYEKGPPPPPSLKKVKFNQNWPINEEIYVTFRLTRNNSRKNYLETVKRNYCSCLHM